MEKPHESGDSPWGFPFLEIGWNVVFSWTGERSLASLFMNEMRGKGMIQLTRINDSLIVINADFIEFVEANPDTIVTLTNGHKYLVKESVGEVVSKVREYKRSIFQKPISSV